MIWGRKTSNHIAFIKVRSEKCLDIKPSSSTDGFDLPYSAEAEQSVLGALIMEPEVISDVVEILPSSDCFYLSVHKLIYQSMLDLFTMNSTIDLVTVLEQLRKNSDYDENEYKTYFMHIADVVPSISRVGEYAEIVRNKYTVRKLIIAARDIIDESHKAVEDVPKLIEFAEQKIFDIRDAKNSNGLEPISRVIARNMKTLDELNLTDSSQRAISTGIGLLDSTITGLNRSDLIILAARPGMGKTSFALNIALHAAKKGRKKVAFFSLEMTKEQLVSRLLSTEGLIQGTKLRTGELDDDEWVRLIEAADVINKTQIYLDDTPGITVNEIKAKLRRLKEVDLVIVDYLQLMSSSRIINNHVQEISEITRNLKILAKEINVPVITLSQLSRASEQRTEHKPQLSDLRDSGSIEQDADIVLFLYRDDYYKNTQGGNPDADKNSGECIVAKNRHGETRSIPLHWQGEFMRFTSQELHREG